MPKVKYTRGMQGSGKSTWAKKYCEENPNWVRISRDDLRHMRGKYWMPKHEKIITKWEYALIDEALDAGYSIVIDEMNLNDKTVTKLKEYLKKKGITDITCKDFTNVPLEVCIERDKNRPFSIGEKVLRETYKKYLDKSEKVVYTESMKLPRAIMCDLDGTLALFDGNPYERDFTSDVLNEPVKNIIDKFKDTHKLIILSGRNSEFLDQTLEWLERHDVKPDVIAMRKIKDFRKDSVVKKEMFEQLVQGKYYVDFVLDDRNQVVELWRSLGLTCLQVADGDF